MRGREGWNKDHPDNTFIPEAKTDQGDRDDGVMTWMRHKQAEE